MISDTVVRNYNKCSNWCLFTQTQARRRLSHSWRMFTVTESGIQCQWNQCICNNNDLGLDSSRTHVDTPMQSIFTPRAATSSSQVIPIFHRSLSIVQSTLRTTMIVIIPSGRYHRRRPRRIQCRCLQSSSLLLASHRSIASPAAPLHVPSHTPSTVCRLDSTDRHLLYTMVHKTRNLS